MPMALTLLIALLLSVSTSWAAIGSVTEQTGQPGEIARSKQKIVGSKGAAVESMDTVSTRGGVVNITFRDDTKVKVNENSRLLIDDFVYDPKASDAGKLAMKVGMGTVRYASGQIAKVNPQQVAIKTPTASIAVRGTDFSMSVDESGRSTIILLPSCRDDQKRKEYELEENVCRVGSIVVETLVGSVTLDQAFQATYVSRATDTPTRPVILNLVESKISNEIIISQPSQIVQAIKEVTEKDSVESSKLEQQAKSVSNSSVNSSSSAVETDSTTVTKVVSQITAGFRQTTQTNSACDPYKKICVFWDREGSTNSERGRATAVKYSDDHVIEVRTTGTNSNTSINVTQGDYTGNEVIGIGDYGGNTVLIRQVSGVLRAQK